MTYLPEQTIKYKTYVKSALVEGLNNVFAAHVDDLLRTTNTTIEYPTTQEHFPAVIVRFFEREIKNMGVGHVEFIADDDDPVVTKYKHYHYDGDIELAVYALSSLDRDLISDSLVQTLAFADLADYTNTFLDRIYNPSDADAKWNYINVNTDRISGFGETQVPTPWQSEDVLVYQTAYRVAITGEFYSLPPSLGELQNIQHINFYPYLPTDATPTGVTDTAEWQ